MDKELDVKFNFFSSFLHLLMNLSYSAQFLIQKLTWTIFVWPAVELVKSLGLEKDEIKKKKLEKPFVILDMLKLSHRLPFNYLRKAVAVNALLAGEKENYYGKILSWDKQIRLIGYAVDKVNFTAELLFKKHSDGSRGVDIVWLHVFKRIGTFCIVSRQEIENQIVVNCVWLSGPHEGKVFKIKNHEHFMSKDRNNPSPDAIYCPPDIVIFIFELLLGAGFVLTIIQLMKACWEMIKPPVGH